MSPFKSKKPCTYSGCPNLTDGGKCEKHRRKIEREYDQARDQTEERQFIHSPEWRALTELKASIDPLCEECLRQGRDTPRNLSHHIKPVKTYPELRLVLENLMSVCDNCHEQVFHKGERWGR